ncbi:MAG: hypothetical protein KDB39_19075, partial [Austwickia sp.]|nr:hypothetical protein [Austwickia sp.]
EAWLFAAAKMSRRIVGAAKTRDIESLPEGLREGAARGVLRVARAFARRAGQDSPIEAMAAIAGAELRAARTS